MARESKASGGHAVAVADSGAKPTLKTISQISGLAVATVSRALSDAPDIKEDTKVLVRRIAREIGYVPNRAGVRLRTGRTNVISLVLPTERAVMSHAAELIASLAAELRGTQFHLTITPYFNDQDPLEPVRYVVENHTADAVILNQITPEDPRVRYLVDNKFPFATHGRCNLSGSHPYFDFDNGEWARIGVRQLKARGCRQIALMAPPTDQTYSQLMISAAKDEAAKVGIPLHVAVNATSDSSIEEIRVSVHQRLQLSPDVGGYICASMRAAMSVVAAAEELGRTVGEDIQIFAKEAAPVLRLFRKNMIVTTEHVGQAGQFLARAAMQAIREPDKPPMQGLEVPTEDELAT
ncbi:LacI family DNA-binding transcriptional regulator [Loktanella sp. IMCC34160]|uniref:LacI family transcriptional regulator n=1 Tax=Loktanella sp. IMCC34160 TaxID=2510646 RepID=UPI00101D1601|nr:LacI family transcriptional regulator [Loktanella sp. IMCC34160]RYG90792.1 LacI family DNA-binding transcriptional regulator [Loktanella sp. IMCC34160]